MTIYRKLQEDKQVGDTMRFRDRFGNEIHGCIQYDSDTGEAIVYDYENEADPNTPIIMKEKYFPDGYCEVDGIANPDPDTMNAVRIFHHIKRPNMLLHEKQDMFLTIRNEVLPRLGLSHTNLKESSDVD